MRTPPALFFTEYASQSAVYYYRQDVPSRSLAQYVNADIIRDGVWKQTNEEQFQQYLRGLAYTDVAHFYAAGGDVTIATQRFLKRLPPVQYGGDIIYPPIFISDLDDNIDFVNPLNFRFRQLGTRTNTGRVLRKGEDVNIVLVSGEKVTLYRDGEAGFDIERNRKDHKSLIKVLKGAHGVSFSTERLRDYYARRYNFQNTYVYPNSVIFEDYPDIPIRRKRGVVRLLWEGGDSHFPDFFPMKRALQRAMEKFPELELVIWGPVYPYTLEGLPKSRVEIHPWVKYDAYKLKLAVMDFDIMFAPLVSNNFNLYKSCIRMYEAASLPRPKPTLAANCPPYSDEIIPGETGLLYDMPSQVDPEGDAFLEQLEKLIRDTKLRRSLASNAKDWVRENRAHDVTVKPLWGWLCETKEKWNKRVAKSRKVKKA